MQIPVHSLPLNDLQALKRARRWLLLGVAALGIAGIFAGLLGSPSGSFFATALVEHVDLSVLIWFLTIECMFFTLAAQGRGWAMLADISFASFVLGAICLILACLTGAPAYKSDYIPVLHHPLFFLGLGLIMSGVLGVVVNLLAVGGKLQVASVPLYGVISAGWIMLVAFACFLRSERSLRAGLQGEIYYEYVFWGGGHILQFVHSQILLVAWAWLAGAAGIPLRIKTWQGVALYFIGLVATMIASCIYVAYPPTSDEFRGAFTALMKNMNGLAPELLGIGILAACCRRLPLPPGEGWGEGPVAMAERVAPHLNPLPEGDEIPGNRRGAVRLPKTCLFMSMLLFAVGGGLGYLIAGSNVTVPAHYHGSIVGITLAFMGVSYLLLPSFGFADVSCWRLASWQPIIYGGGQLCWMTGMAVLGHHGVPRKTAGSADTMGAFASFLKHGGDGLALIGGLLFVFVVLRAVFKRDKTNGD